MKLGLAMFPIHDGLPPAELAVLAQDGGFESIFFPEHTHIPASRESWFIGAPPGVLTREYWNTYDPFVALMAAASATTTLKIGTGVCLVAQRDPIVTAKLVASVDRLSGGRFLFGIGAGWNKEEMANHGTDFSGRFCKMREHVEAMKQIWTQDEASYEGQDFEFDRIWCWPKPLQQPYPPILVGGAGPKVLDRVLAYGDEWYAEPGDNLRERIAELFERASAAGRDGQVQVTVVGADPADVPMWTEAGVHRCVFWLPPSEPTEVRSAVRDLTKALDLALRASAVG